LGTRLVAALKTLEPRNRDELICVLLAVRTVIQFQDEYPWFLSGNQFVGDRASDVHLTNAMKRATTDQARGK